MNIEAIRSLRHRFDPRQTLLNIAAAFSDVIPLDRIGVAAPSMHRSEFRVLGLWDRRVGLMSPGGVFPFAGTAGGWVREFGVPIMGCSPDEMKPYPQTHDYLLRERLASNCLLPLDLGAFGRGVMYLLSRQTAAFRAHNLGIGLRVKEVIESGVRASLAVEQLEHGSEIEPVESGTAKAPPGDRLHDVERRHIEQVLERTNGLIDGQRGAARILGLHPSTLRNRMKRLGARRFPRDAR